MITICNFIKYLCIIFMICFFGSAGPMLSASEPHSFPVKHNPFLDRFCLDCHNNETQKGKFNLETLSYTLSDEATAGAWQKILDVLHAEEMPPENKPQPSGQVLADFMADLATTLVNARKALQDSGRKTVMRRLNRRDYKNTMMSLFNVSVNIEDLPEDNFTDGFDTDGSTLTISEDDLLTYMQCGRDVIDQFYHRLDSYNTKKVKHRVQPENNPRHKNIHKEIKNAANNKERAYYRQFLSEDGAYLRCVKGLTAIEFTPSYNLPSGDYIVRIKAVANKNSDPRRHFLELGTLSKMNGVAIQRVNLRMTMY